MLSVFITQPVLGIVRCLFHRCQWKTKEHLLQKLDHTSGALRSVGEKTARQSSFPGNKRQTKLSSQCVSRSTHCEKNKHGSFRSVPSLLKSVTQNSSFSKSVLSGSPENCTRLLLHVFLFQELRCWGLPQSHVCRAHRVWVLHQAWTWTCNHTGLSAAGPFFDSRTTLN